MQLKAHIVGSSPKPFSGILPHQYLSQSHLFLYIAEIVVDQENQAVMVHNTTDLDEAEVAHMNLMRLHAQSQWWDEGHPGWGIWNEQDGTSLFHLSL